MAKRNSFVIYFFIANILIQGYGISRIVYPQTDEGVYLYEAKLISQGFIPYKDFNLAGHTPFLQYIVAVILKFVHFNINQFDYMYIVWVFIALFPLYLTITSLTKNKYAAIFCILIFSTYVEFVQWDAHFFEIREASLPFFAFFIFFFFTRKNTLLAQIFLCLFSLCLVSNLFISLLFIVFTVYIESKNNLSIFIKNIFGEYKLFFITTVIPYSFILLIPNSFQNFFISQTHFVTFSTRIFLILQIFPINWPILIFGFWGIYILRKRIPLLSLLSIITVFVCIFFSKSFSQHYLSIISVPFAITSAFFFDRYWRKFTIKNSTVLLLLIYWVILTTAPTLYFYLIENNTPEFFVIIKKLKKLPDPLFTFEPIYALYAHKNLTFYYDCANMRIIRVTGENLTNDEYEQIIMKSKTILIEPFAAAWLPKKAKEEIANNFILVFKRSFYLIYTKNN